MGTYGFDECDPPRRGAVWALTVDSTARAYDLSKAAIGGYTPEGSLKKRAEVYVWMQAQTNDVFFYFHTADASADLSDTAAQSAAEADLTFADSYCAVLEAGESPIKVRLNRSLDKFIIVKAASTSGILRMWAASDSE